MAVQVLVPNLGPGSNTGRVVEWCRPDGATVDAGEALALYESDHMIVELEAAAAGVLRHGPESSPGAECPPGNVLAVILAPGERLESASFAVESATAPAHPGAMMQPASAAAGGFGGSDGQAAPVLPLRRNTLPQAAPLPPDSAWAPIPGDEVADDSDWLSRDAQELPAGWETGAQAEDDEAGVGFGAWPGTAGPSDEPETAGWAEEAGAGEEVFAPVMEDEATDPAEEPAGAGEEAFAPTMEDEARDPGEADGGMPVVSSLDVLDAAAGAGWPEPSFEAADRSAAAPRGDDRDEEDILSAFEESERAEDAAFEDEPDWEVRFATRFAGQQLPAMTPPLKHHAEDPRPYFDIAPYADGVTAIEAEAIEAGGGIEPDAAAHLAAPAAAYEPDSDFAFALDTRPAAQPQRDVLTLRATVDLRECLKMAAQLGREWRGTRPADEDIVLRAFARAMEEARMDVPGNDLAVVVPHREGTVTTAVRDVARRPFREACAARANGGDGDFDEDRVRRLVSFAAVGIDEGVPGVLPQHPFALALGAPREWAVFEGERVVPATFASLVLAYDPGLVEAGEAAWLLGRVRELLEAPYALLAA